MYLSTLIIIIAAEALVLAIATSLGIYVFYRKKRKVWQKVVKNIRNRIRDLRDLSNKYSMIKENLHSIMLERDKLKKALQTNKDSPDLAEKISVLNKELKDKSRQLNQTRARLQKEIQDVESLSEKMGNDEDLEKNTKDKKSVKESSQPAAIEATPKRVMEPDNQKTVMRDHGEKSKQEFNRLKTMNVEQKGLISDLKRQLSELSFDGSKLDANETVVPRLGQMLKESETCINMLEDELTTVIASLNEKSLQLSQLEGKASSTNEQPLLAENTSNDDNIADLKSQLESAMSMTMTMMTASGDQSNIISFARNSISCENLESLAEEIQNTANSYNLKGCIQIRSRTGVDHYPDDKTISEENLQLLSDKLDGERFQDNGDSLTVRFENLTLLLNGMPEEDPDTSARYKDSMAIIMELAQAQFESLEDEQVFHQQQAVLKKVIRTTQKTIEKVEQKSKFQAKQSKLIIDSMTGVLGNPTFVKEMSETFQPIYKGIIEETREKFDELNSKNAAVDETFARIINELSSRI